MFWRKKKPQQQTPPQPSSTPKPASKAPGAARPKLSLLSLESRLMFDAAAAATAAEVNQEQVAQEQAESAVSNDNTARPESQASIENQELLQAITTYSPGETHTEVAFVDPTVPDYQSLIAGMGPNVQVIMLDGGQDGMGQIAASLSGRTGIDAIHLISHGAEGQLSLGTGTLTQASMTDQYADELATIRQSLSESADILVYGCDFAEGQVGQDTATLLSQLTGADVAASTDATGYAEFGGDWVLETQTGSIETTVVVTDEVQANWKGLLAEIWMNASTGAVIAGPAGNDWYVGDSANNTPVSSAGGADIMYGAGGDDTLTSGSGNDILVGGTGNDTISGGSDDDVILGGTGNDYLDGGSAVGKNTIIGGGGSDQMVGGSGGDVFRFTGAQSGDAYTVDGGGATDIIDLSEFSTATITNSGGVITVDRGGGNVFTINHSNVETVITAAIVGNHGPLADAGPDQTIATGSAVTLTAAGSSDQDGNALTYQWTQIEGSKVTLSSSTAASPTFTAPSSATTLQFVVVVSDGTTSHADTVTINVSTVNVAPTISNLSGDSLSYTEGAGAVVIEQGANALVADSDSANFDTGTLTVSIPSGNEPTEDVLSIRNQGTGAGQIGVSWGNVTYGGVTIGTFSGGAGGNNLVITFNANATPTTVTALARNITYEDINTDSPTSGAFTIRFTLTDGDGGTTANYDVSANVTAVNDAPTDLALSANTVAENAANGTVVGSVTGTDVDTGDTKTYSLTDTAGGRFAINSSTGELTVANGSLLNYEAATIHTVTVRVTDSGGLTYDETFTINLTNVNEAPTGADATVTLTEDTAHTFTTANFGFGDVDAGDSLSAVRIDSLPTPGSLTLSGVAIVAGQVVSVADITAGNLVFTPAADANGTGYASFTFSVRDSSNAYDAVPNTLTFDVTAVNDAPTITNLGGDSLSYSEGDGAVVIEQDSNVTVNDVDSTNFDTGTLTVSIPSGGDSAEDVLSIRNQGTGAGQIGVSGSNVTYEGVTIGAVTGGSSGSDLVITLNSNATLTAVTALVQNITYENTDTAAPTTGARMVRFVLTDGDGGTSANYDTTVTVGAVNDAPVAADDRAGLTFDGVDDFVDMGSGVVYKVTNTMTMEAWINREPSTQTTQIIINKEGEYEVGLDSDGSLKWAFANTNPGWAWHDTGVVISVNTWTHIAVTYDNGTITSYVNGVAVETFAGSGTIGDVYPTKESLRVGGRENNPANQYFTGQISEAQVWNVARTAGEISGDLNGTLAGSETGLLGYWKFNENTGTTADNLTANSDGTLGGGVSGQTPQWATYRVNEDTTLTASGSGVIGNDYDADGDTLSAIMVTGPSHASAFTLNPDGSFSYTPAANFSGTDSFTYQVSDGTNLSNVATVNIQVDPVNDAPTITNLNSDSLSYSEGDGAVVIEQGDNALVADVDSTNLDTGTLTVSIPSGGDSAEDVLSIRNQGTGAGQIGVSGSNVTYQGVTIGTFTGGSSGSNLVIMLNANATPTAVTALVKNITYENTDTAAPTTGARTVRYVLTDGDGGTSANYDTTVTVSAVNDAPTDLSNGIELNTDGGNDAYLISDTGLSQSLTATTVEIRFAANDLPLETVLMSFNNPVGDEFSIQLDDPSNNLEIDCGAGTIALASAIDYRAALVDGAVHTLSVSWDSTAGDWSVYIDGSFIESGTGLSVGTTLDTTNGQFVFGQEQDAQNSGYDSTQYFSGTFYDVRIWNDVRTAGEIVQYYEQQLDVTPAEAAAVGLLADWQMDGFDGANQVVELVSGNNLSIVHASGAGFITGAVDSQLSIEENSANGSHVGFVTTEDSDAGETFSYSLTDSAGGRFAVNSATGEITVANGTLLDYDTATSHNITVRVTDSGGLTYDETFTINLTNVNETPTDLSLSANTVAENAANGTVVGTVSGTDPDTGDTKTYSLTDTAGGRFAINATTGEITVANGSLLNYEAATSHSVIVRVMDAGGLTYDETFTINLTNANEAPTGADATVMINEDTSHTLTTANFGFSDVDAGDSLSAVRIDTIPTAGSLTLSGMAVTAGQIVTVADITAGNLVFTPASDANGTGYANFTFSVRDSNNAYAAAPNMLTFDVTAVNDAPIRTAGMVSNLTVSEDAGLVSLGLGSVTYSPSGGADESGQTLTYAVTALPSGTIGNVYLADGTTLVTLSSYTLAEIQGMQFQPTANASGVTAFQFNVSDSGGTANGGANSISQFILLTVTAVNDAPTITNLSGDSLSYSEGDRAVVIEQGGNALVADVDSTNLDTGTLTVSIPAGGDSAEDVLSIRNQGTGVGQIGVSGSTITYGGTIIGTFTGGSSGTNLVITLNASATPTAVTALVQNITYENTDTNAPTTGARTVRYVLTDGDGGTSANYDTTVTVSAVNDAPVVTPVAPDVTFVEGGLAQLIDATGTITDVDSANLDGGVLTVSISANGTADDRLIVGNWGTGPGQVGVSGSNVTYEGTLIGTVSGGTSGSDPLVITFNTNATPTAVQEVYRSIQFNNVSENPSTATRTLTIGLTDGDGGTATPQNKLVYVQGANDAPVLTFGEGDKNFTEGALAVMIDTLPTISDLDSTNFDTGTLTITISANPSVDDRVELLNTGMGAGQIGVSGTNVYYGGTLIGTQAGGIGAAPFVVTFNANADADIVGEVMANIRFWVAGDSPSTATRTVEAVLTDGDGGTSLTASKQITVTVVDDPTVVTGGTSGTGTEDTTVTGTLTATDVEGLSDGTVFSVTGAATNGTASIDPATGLWSYTPTADWNGSDSFTVTITDNAGNTATQVISVTVTPVNDAPTLTVNTGSTVAEGGTDTIGSSELAGTDIEQTAAQLVYSIGTGPANGRLELTTAPGMSTTTFTQADIIANRLVYVHDGSETTSDSFTFTVNDGAGGSIGSTTVTLTITPVNDTPNITSDGGASTAAINVVENVSAVTIVTGADVDLPAQALTYNISGGTDQARFTINTVTGALNFTASPNFEAATDSNGDNVYVVEVQVTDSQGASTTQTIQVTVTDVAEGVPPPPDPTVPPVLLSPTPPSPTGPGLVPSSPSSPAEPPTDALPQAPVLPDSRSAPAESHPATVLPSPTERPVVIRPEESRATIDEAKDSVLFPWIDEARRLLLTGLLGEPTPTPESEPAEKSQSVSDLLFSKLDEMTASLEQAMGLSQEQHVITMRIAALTGTTLSAGFIAWALRSGTLLASFMATMPAWRHFDPLPVLGGSRREWERRRKEAEQDQHAEATEFKGLKHLLDLGLPPDRKP